MSEIAKGPPVEPPPGRGLGRRVAPDSRDRAFLLSRPSAAVLPVSRYWWSPGAEDQGSTSECVAYAGIKYLMSGPLTNDAPMPHTRLYQECQKIDEWPGEDYDGTSVRALFKVLQRVGLVKEYRWAFDQETVVAQVLGRSPVVMGTTWTEGMFWPDKDGYIRPIGRYAGGHAWTIVGANRNRRNPDGSMGAVRMVNSWGRDWGEGGRAWITFHDLDWLIKDWGEACCATEIDR